MSAIPSIWTPHADFCPSCGKPVRRAANWLRRKRDWLRGLRFPWANFTGEDYVDATTGELIVDATTGEQDVNSSGACCCNAGTVCPTDPSTLPSSVVVSGWNHTIFVPPGDAISGTTCTTDWDGTLYLITSDGYDVGPTGTETYCGYYSDGRKFDTSTSHCGTGLACELLSDVPGHTTENGWLFQMSACGVGSGFARYYKLGTNSPLGTYTWYSQTIDYAGTTYPATLTVS